MEELDLHPTSAFFGPFRLRISHQPPPGRVEEERGMPWLRGANWFLRNYETGLRRCGSVLLGRTIALFIARALRWIGI